MIKLIVIDVLLGLATMIMLLCILGLVSMRSVYQRLHYAAPIVGLSVPLILIAVWVQTNEFQARIKALMIFAVLFGMNAFMAHATARAARVREKDHWELTKDDTEVEKIT